MSGVFGVVSTKDCVKTLFYGTDYHSHLGTQKAGLVVLNRRLERSIHDISTSQFKSKFIDELPKMKGTMGIGVISDSDPQPIIISSSFGDFALVFNISCTVFSMFLSLQMPELCINFYTNFIYFLI